MYLLFAQSTPPSPLVSVGIALVAGLIIVGMLYTGRNSVRSKTAKATGLEELLTKDSGKLSGGSAVLKGYILFFGGIGLLLLSIAVLISGLYSLIFA